MLAHALLVILATAASGQPPPPMTLTLDTGTQAPADPVTACAARRLRDPDVAARLRSADGAEAIHAVLTTDAWRGETGGPSAGTAEGGIAPI